MRLFASFLNIARTLRVLITLVVATEAAAAHAGGLEEITRAFAASEFVFNRARSDIPFPPLAWLDVSVYGDSHFLTPTGEASKLSFTQTSVSEATLLPFLLSRRDVLVAGQWMDWTRFELSNGANEDVFSAALPLGWTRQVSADWQIAAFVAPLAHTSEGGAWYWEYMGGVFARRLHGERLAWLFGLYADVSARESFYLPYVGVSWTLDERWTLSAILPWPAILYSPAPDWLLRLGVAPAEASWSVRADDELDQPQIEFGSWNLGLSVERRLHGGFWLAVQAGVAGLRGFAFAGSDWEGPNSELGTDGYVSLTINFRPAVPEQR